MSKFGAGVTESQMRLARKFEQAGLCSFSQAVKAFQRGESDKIADWKRKLQERAED